MIPSIGRGNGTRWGSLLSRPDSCPTDGVHLSQYMDEDRFNIAVRKFLKEVGVTSQRVIENAVRDAVKSGQLQGNEKLRAKMTLEILNPAIRHVVERDIELE